MSVDTNLEQRVALVTGASRRGGIGAAICRSLARAGAQVAFTHWQPYDQTTEWGADPDGPSNLLAELRACGVLAAAIELDLAHADAAVQVLDAVTSQLGPPTILINNAAHSTLGGYRSLNAATIDAHYAVNVRSAALLCVEFARRYAGGLGGRIINMTSGQGRGPMPGELAYAMSKGAIEALTTSLASDLAPLGITINAIDPGPTDSGWMTEEIKASLLPTFPMGRLGQPEDAARIVLFLASDQAGWITGQIIRSDGGFLPTIRIP
ncbi:MAG: SDR family oxidoreductase [Chloroflexota bacterium]|nr:SDR family oxidoreductase [Chloroflexota bacterium]